MFASSAQRALEALRDTEAFFHEEETGTELSGKLRISCSHTLSIRRLAPLIARFHACYPSVAIETALSVHYVDLLDEGIDLAVRIMTLGNSPLAIRKLSEDPLVICASPKYLATHPTIKSEAGLKANRLLYIPQHGSLYFAKAGKKLSEVGQPAAMGGSDGDFGGVGNRRRGSFGAITVGNRARVAPGKFKEY